MTKFAVAYTSFLIGFMVMFMILFSDQEVFNVNFLGVFGKVLHMVDMRHLITHNRRM